MSYALSIYRRSKSNPDQYKHLLKYVLQNCNLKNDQVCHELICGFAQFGYAKQIYSVYSFMKNNNMNINRMDFENGIIASGKCHYYRECVEIFEYLKSMNVVDERSYNNIINALRKCGKMEEVLQYFDEMQSKGYTPNIVLLNSILSMFLENNKYSDAILFYNDIKKNGYQMNNYTYNILLNYLCNNNYFDEVDKILNEMKENNIMPDVISYCLLIVGNGKKNDMKNCIKYYLEYKDKFLYNNKRSNENENIRILDSFCSSCIYTNNISLGIKELDNYNRFFSNRLNRNDLNICIYLYIYIYNVNSKFTEM